MVFAKSISLALSFMTMAVCLCGGVASVRACEAGADALGVSRIVEIETRSGPLFGQITKQVREDDFLKPMEVVLTFDDGPVPWITGPILKTLKAHCTKATFFSVGKMAKAYPETVHDIVQSGHTLGGHTWSHPLNLPKMAKAKAVAEIERGFASLVASSGGEIAPFFRFPGLNDSGPLLTYLQERGIASFTVDVVSDDSFISDPDELVRVTMRRIIARRGGIVLFHDIKPATAKALPAILDELKARGFSVVHLRPSEHLEADPSFAGEFSATAKVLQLRGSSNGEGIRPPLLPFYGAVLLERALDPDTVGRPVTRLVPELRNRSKTAARAPETSRRSAPVETGSSPNSTGNGALNEVLLPEHKPSRLPAILRGSTINRALPPRPPYSSPP